MAISSEKWQEFLVEFAASARIRHSAALVGLSAREIYSHLDKHDEDIDDFERAKSQGIDAAEELIFDRGFIGTEIVNMVGGKKVITRSEVSDALAMFWMKGNRPEKYRDGGADTSKDPLCKMSNEALEELITQKLASRK